MTKQDERVWERYFATKMHEHQAAEAFINTTIEAFNGEIRGSWVEPAYVFPREFVDHLIERGRITKREAHAMESASFDHGRGHHSDDVPDWALAELRQWQASRAIVKECREEQQRIVDECVVVIDETRKR